MKKRKSLTLTIDEDGISTDFENIMKWDSPEVIKTKKKNGKRNRNR